MTEQGARAIAAVARLRTALEQTAAALASPRLEALLDAEMAIELSLADMPPIDLVSAEERQVVRGEIERASGALLRCRRLGMALGDFVRTSLEAQGRGAEYGPRQSAMLPYPGHVLNARV